MVQPVSSRGRGRGRGRRPLLGARAPGRCVLGRSRRSARGRRWSCRGGEQRGREAREREQGVGAGEREDGWMEVQGQGGARASVGAAAACGSGRCGQGASGGGWSVVWRCRGWARVRFGWGLDWWGWLGRFWVWPGHPLLFFLFCFFFLKYKNCFDKLVLRNKKIGVFKTFGRNLAGQNIVYKIIWMVKNAML